MQPNKSRLKTILKACKGQEIIVVGDIMLDHFIKGSVSRISPEAPVPVVDVKKEFFVAGGAGNVAVNLAALDAKPVMISVVGPDVGGEMLKDFLRKRGVNISGICEDSDRPTTQKIRVMADQQQVVRFDRESKKVISPAIARACMKNFENAVQTAKGVILSDYGKGMLSDQNIQKIISLCRKKHIPVCVDPKIDNFKKYKHITCMTPNTKEAWEGVGAAPKSGEEAIEKLGQKILKMLEADSILITRSAEGMSLFEKGAKKPYTVRATAREVYDVTGAGDTVISVLTLALAAGANLKEAAVLANYAAGIVVEKSGTATTSRQEIEGVLP
ncbi:D-glycero-beta-D-manno-heptose-7-phosphate kinase [Candidatus Avelusimicrobium luingense]|uniref:D-glycero-beta-D-manno-heptose-7-phosphate kinase n=1 Tax=Candidatus Avelusimicrobium luingense TaxID=3416211 RepID=UPI003D0EA731